MRVVRLVLIWIVAFAVPLQVAAAASMRFCADGPAALHARSAPPADHAHHAGPSGSAHHADSAGHGHHGGMHDTEASTTDDAAAGACSACAACCAPMAPATVVAVPIQRATATPIAAPGAPSPAFLTDGPERPPRSLRA
jgi:hypothetical protein